jgi:hypothetical protein
MSTFVKGGSTGTPFGRNEFLRSTQDIKTESYTLSGLSIPSRTIDSVAGQKILQPGTIMAKITAGTASEIGKIGPWNSDAAVVDGRSTAANIVGICMTFLPWQAIERDVEISVVYEASAVQAWCLEYNAAAATLPIALTNTTAAFMQRGGAAGKAVDITWK